MIRRTLANSAATFMAHQFTRLAFATFVVPGMDTATLVNLPRVRRAAGSRLTYLLSREIGLTSLRFVFTKGDTLFYTSRRALSGA